MNLSNTYIVFEIITYTVILQIPRKPDTALLFRALFEVCLQYYFLKETNYFAKQIIND